MTNEASARGTFGQIRQDRDQLLPTFGISAEHRDSHSHTSHGIRNDICNSRHACRVKKLVKQDTVEASGNQLHNTTSSLDLCPAHTISKSHTRTGNHSLCFFRHISCLDNYWQVGKPREEPQPRANRGFQLHVLTGHYPRPYCSRGVPHLPPAQPVNLP